MKLSSRLFVLYCPNGPKRRQNQVLYPNFEEVRGGAESWLMARWKARVEFLLSVTELLFLSLTVEALQGKMCQNSLPSGGGGHVTWSQDFREKRSAPCQYIDTTRKAIDCATTLPLTVVYIIKLCSRLFVLCCRNWPKGNKFRYFITIFRKLGAAQNLDYGALESMRLDLLKCN